VVLTPTDDPDVDPCTPVVVDTGSVAVLPDGRPFAVYATANASSLKSNYDGNLCLAIATDASMTSWTRHGSIADNPTCARCTAACQHCTRLGSNCSAAPAPPGCVPPIPQMIPRFGFRDPTTPYLAPCRLGASTHCWFVVVGSGTERNRSAAGLLYRSASATDVTSRWTFDSVLIEENAGRASEQYQYSCPDWFELTPGRWLWMSLLPQWNLGSALDANIYYTGKLNEATHTFIPSTPMGPPYKRFGHTIAKSGGGPGGRRILWGAVCGIPAPGIPAPRSYMTNASRLHTGCTMGLGQELSMRSDSDQLQFRFIPELRSLRKAAGHYRRAYVAPGTVLPSGLLLELQLNFSAGATGSAAVDLIVGGGVRLGYIAKGQSHGISWGELYISGAAVHPSPIAVPLSLADGEQLRMHVYLDGSVVEVIACDRAPLAAIILPSLPAGASTQLAIVSGSPPADVEVWPLEPAVEFVEPPSPKTEDEDLRLSAASGGLPNATIQNRFS
jgi:sucrose-6-phosphate hydrolase SacC (GH32 family)